MWRISKRCNFQLGQYNLLRDGQLKHLDSLFSQSAFNKELTNSYLDKCIHQSSQYHTTRFSHAKKFVPDQNSDKGTNDSFENRKKLELQEKLNAEEGRNKIKNVLSRDFEATDDIRDAERLRIRGMLWPWLLIFSTTVVATGVIISLWRATYTENGIDYFWSDLISEDQRYKLVEFLSFNAYNWSFLHKERIIESIVHTLDKGGDPEEWFYAIHALFSLIGAVRAETRLLFVNQLTKYTSAQHLLLCMKDPLLLKESNRYEGADTCLEELASIIYSVYIKMDNHVEVTKELETLLIEFSEHGNIVHKRIASEFFTKIAPQSPMIQEYLKRINLQDLWKNSNRFGYDECIVQNFIKAKKLVYEVPEEEIPDHFINKKSKTLQSIINTLFGIGDLSRSNIFQSTLRSMLYSGFPLMIFWMYRFNRHIGLDFRKSTYLATRCLTRPLLFSFTLNLFRIFLQYSEEKFLGKKERSKSTIITLAIARYLLLYIIALAMVWQTPEFSFLYPLIMYLIPWNMFSARVTGVGVSAIPRKDHSYTDPMFFKAQRRVY